MDGLAFNVFCGSDKCGKQMLCVHPKNKRMFQRVDGLNAQVPGGRCQHCGEFYDLGDVRTFKTSGKSVVKGAPSVELKKNTDEFLMNGKKGAGKVEAEG